MGACTRNMQSNSAEIKPAQCCIKLVFHLTYTMMHGSTKLKKENPTPLSCKLLYMHLVLDLKIVLDMSDEINGRNKLKNFLQTAI